MESRMWLFYVALAGLSCLFPLWRHQGRDFTSLFAPPPGAAPDGPRLPQEIAALPPADRVGLQLYIDPEACICCGACAPACPVEAIFDEEDLPAKWAGYRAINARFFMTPRAE